MFQNFSHHRWLSEPSHLQMKRHSYWALLAAVLLIGAWIRIWGLGSLDEILFEGHEANYLIYYRHLDQPNVGDTANYPAMQWWWYLWGSLRQRPMVQRFSFLLASGYPAFF